MSITLLTGPTGSGKSRYLIETVNEARRHGRAVSTFMSSTAVARSPNPGLWAYDVIGCREPGLVCQLDHLVPPEACRTILAGLQPGALAAFDEARLFGVEVVPTWREASQRGVELLISTPSEEQRRALEEHASEVHFGAVCSICGEREATTSRVLPGDPDPQPSCDRCDAEARDAARHEILERLERQAPYPGERAIYQPVELPECAGWRVLRSDSSARAELLREVIRERLPDLAYRPRTYLDLGCNTGYFCHQMDEFGLAARGVDVVEDDIAVARLLTNFVRHDNCSYTVADVYEYLRETRHQRVDVISAFSVIQWLMLQQSVDRGLDCLQLLFEKTAQLCFLEMGYASEPTYAGQLPDYIDRAWVHQVMEGSGQFAEVVLYEAASNGLMRDLFVGIKSSDSQSVDQGSPADSLALSSPFDAPHELAMRLLPLLGRLLESGARSDIFQRVERRGFHVTPVDFYHPIPDTRALDPELWERTSELPGIDMNLDGQLELLTKVFPRFEGEYNRLPAEPEPDPKAFYLGNGLFDGTDALAYFCMIRHFRPTRIIEIGSGFSTLLAAQTLRGRDAELVVVDPNPSDLVAGGIPGLASIHQARVETMDVAFFDALAAGDFLFIDSSHVSRIGGDVNFLLLEVIPRIARGVFVHFHDIFLPKEYPKEWVLEKHRFWTEQYLLQSFLAFNREFEVVLCNSLLGLRYQDELRRTFPRSPWWGGGSTWIRRVR